MAIFANPGVSGSVAPGAASNPRRAALVLSVVAAGLILGLATVDARRVAARFRAGTPVRWIGAVAIDPAEPLIVGLFRAGTGLLMASLGPAVESVPVTTGGDSR